MGPQRQLSALHRGQGSWSGVGKGPGGAGVTQVKGCKLVIEQIRSDHLGS